MGVADTANNRVLVWDGVPAGGPRPADRVLGQLDAAANGENGWQAVAGDVLLALRSVAHGSRLAVADFGNNRVMIWELR
jgi:hypothetical protein